jgi:hypothetical protein
MFTFDVGSGNWEKWPENIELNYLAYVSHDIQLQSLSEDCGFSAYDIPFR